MAPEDECEICGCPGGPVVDVVVGDGGMLAHLGCVTSYQ